MVIPMIPTVLVDQDIQPKDHLVQQFEELADLSIGVNEDEKAVGEALSDKDGIVTTSRIPLNGAVLEGANHLDFIAKIGTGLDSIDLDTAEEEGITVLYTPGLNAFAIAEYSLTLLLAVQRNLVTNQRILQEGGWRDEAPLSRSLVDATVGIVGFGNIGQHLGQLLSGFNVELLVYDPYVDEPDVHRAGAERTDLDTLLQESDAVSVNAVLTEETRGLIGWDEIDRMKSTAIVVNTARGPIVDQAAVADAVRNGELAGGGLDVFEDEPLSADSELHDVDGIVISPHVAGTSYASRTKCIDALADAVSSHLEGNRPQPQNVAVSVDE